MVGRLLSIISMRARDRPLSPHIQIYRPQLTSVMSITHRLTGLALSAGSPILVLWLVQLAAGPRAYEVTEAFWHSWLGLALLFGWTFSFFYHLCNGIRHLFWDIGIGFDLGAIYTSGWVVLIVSGILTVLCWLASDIVGR
jgi:succinate dehydrogenase / fumarate reductase cytochrome b subunit